LPWVRFFLSLFIIFYCISCLKIWHYFNTTLAFFSLIFMGRQFLLHLYDRRFKINYAQKKSGFVEQKKNHRGAEFYWTFYEFNASAFPSLSLIIAPRNVSTKKRHSHDRSDDPISCLTSLVVRREKKIWNCLRGMWIVANARGTRFRVRATHAEAASLPFACGGAYVSSRATPGIDLEGGDETRFWNIHIL